MTPRRRVVEEEEEERQEGEERIIVWCSKETKLRWNQFRELHRTMDKNRYRNNEVLINKLLDLYELCRKFFKKDLIDDIIEELQLSLGTLSITLVDVSQR